MRVPRKLVCMHRRRFHGPSSRAMGHTGQILWARYRRLPSTVLWFECITRLPCLTVLRTSNVTVRGRFIASRGMMFFVRGIASRSAFAWRCGAILSGTSFMGIKARGVRAGCSRAGRGGGVRARRFRASHYGRLGAGASGKRGMGSGGTTRLKRAVRANPVVQNG